jgi:hypothetical protein
VVAVLVAVVAVLGSRVLNRAQTYETIKYFGRSKN